ncbi:protein FAM98B-like [Scleropages formosus]|uniref:Protein FAM98B-like n=1 Tax=Scleropages formosus TaxID=113540 RepID=A0A0P7X3H6_SCLFO|nr:protein FAM98B-like [Scleropages formosus]
MSLYDGPLNNEQVLLKASECGFSSPEYTSLCLWLTLRLKLLCSLEEWTPINADDTDGLQLQISRLLKEMSCPYPCLMSENLLGSLKNKDSCLKLICNSELQAAQIMHSKHLHSCELDEERTALQDLRVTCRTLKPSEPKGRSAVDIFSAIESKMKLLLEDLPKEHIGKPALKVSLNPGQWAKLEQINSTLCAEYEYRRRMLIKRLDVTVQSFGWSERAKEQIDRMAKAYQPLRYLLTFKASVSLSHLLAAREDIRSLKKTSSGLIREKTACAINKVLMGSVPDRGGRPSEIEAPLPEMPTWQKRQDGGGRDLLLHSKPQENIDSTLIGPKFELEVQGL